MITLKEFIRETLREVVEGIKEAQDFPEIGGQIAPSMIGGMKFPADSGVVYEANILATAVKFDIAVTADMTKKGEAGGGFQIGVFSAKGEGKIEARDSRVHRINFAVPIVYPVNRKTWHE